MKHILAVLIAITLAHSSPQALAESLDPPKGRVVLTVSGQIREVNTDGEAHLDRDLLEKMGMTKIVTDTPWTEGNVTFEGVPGADLLQKLGADGNFVRAVALNDYEVRIPISDFSERGALLALKRDGAYMRVRDKGPVWIIYPWLENSELRSEVYYARAIWQLKSLEVYRED